MGTVECGWRDRHVKIVIKVKAFFHSAHSVRRLGHNTADSCTGWAIFSSSTDLKWAAKFWWLVGYHINIFFFVNIVVDKTKRNLKRNIFSQRIVPLLHMYKKYRKFTWTSKNNDGKLLGSAKKKNNLNCSRDTFTINFYKSWRARPMTTASIFGRTTYINAYNILYTAWRLILYLFLILRGAPL